MLGVERKPELQLLEGIKREGAQGVEDQDGQRVAHPIHLLVYADSAEPVERGFSPA